MSVFTDLLGENLLDGDKKVKTADVLNGKDQVAIYFSAHWCPPCRKFTPQFAKTYKKMMDAGKKFEVVFASSDKDQSSFDEYFAEMPWKAIPFSDRDIKAKLSSKYGVRGIPCVVLLDSQGNIVSKDGSTFVRCDSEGENFPWKELTLEECLGDELLSGSGKVKTSSLKNKMIGLYFSAHWCPPCKNFTPKLAEVYKALKAENKDFEIIFSSSDNDEKAFKEYFAEMPWTALPYSKRYEDAQLSNMFEVRGIPRLVILDNIESGQIINKNAVSAVRRDGAKAYPFIPPTSTDVNEECDGIEEHPSLVSLGEGKHIDVIKALGTKHSKDAKKMNFFYEKEQGRISVQIRNLTDNSEGTALVILDLSKGKFYQYENKDMSEASIEKFITSFRSGDLNGKELNG